MKARSCEEYVLGLLESKETALDACLKENGKLSDAVDYAERVLGVLGQLVGVKKGCAEGRYIVYPKVANAILNLENEGDGSIFDLLAPLIGDEDARAEYERRKAAFGAKHEEKTNQED